MTKTRRGGYSKTANYKQMEPGVQKSVHQYFLSLARGKSGDTEQKNEEIWRVSSRTDNRKVKAVECHQSTGMKQMFPRGRTKRSGG